MKTMATAMGRVAAIVAVSLAIVAIPVAAQTGTVTGVTTDAISNAGARSVQVHIVGTGLGTLTNESGRYLILNVPAGSYTLRAERIGYAAQDIQINVTAGSVVT